MVLASSFVVHSIRRFLDAAAGSCSEAAASSGRTRRIIMAVKHHELGWNPLTAG